LDIGDSGWEQKIGIWALVLNCNFIALIYIHIPHALWALLRKQDTYRLRNRRRQSKKDNRKMEFQKGNKPEQNFFLDLFADVAPLD
jgi:hypothetical protein